MVNQSLGPIYERLETAKQLISQMKTPDERLALSHYIGNVYIALLCMGDMDVSFNRNKAFGGRKRYLDVVKKLNLYGEQLAKDYVLKKDFHTQFFGEVIPEVEKEMCDFCQLSFPVEEKFSKEDFFEVFSLFLDELHLGELFDEFYRNYHIHSSIAGQDAGNLGFTLHNPINGETDIFVKDFKYDFSSMNTLAHELGHGFDLTHFDEGVENYNRYFYLSFFGEVIPRLMERLLLRFCIRNGIQVDTAKDKYIDFELVNHDYLLKCYILGLLDDSFLVSGGYLDCDTQLLIKKIKNYFVPDCDLESTITRIGPFDLSQDYNYAYGDILSLFLCEEVEKNGFFNEMLEYYMKKRSDYFQEDFMRECGFGPSNYTKLYKKETEFFKR